MRNVLANIVFFRGQKRVNAVAVRRVFHDQRVCFFTGCRILRDFRRFMLMRPTDYAQMPHPIAVTAARARSAVLGEPMQALHIPDRTSREPLRGLTARAQV